MLQKQRGLMPSIEVVTKPSQKHSESPDQQHKNVKSSVKNNKKCIVCIRSHTMSTYLTRQVYDNEYS